MMNCSRKFWTGSLSPVLVLTLIFLSISCGESSPSDGNTNLHRPQILVQLCTPSPFGTITARQTKSGDTPEKQGFTIAVKDSDKQVLFFRMFVNAVYTSRVPISQSQSSGGLERQSIIFDVDGICDSVVNNVLGNHNLELYVSDSKFLDSGADLRMSMNGGMRDNVYWTLSCMPK